MRKFILIILIHSFFLLSANIFYSYAVDVPYNKYGFFDQSGKEKKTELKVIGKVIEVKNDKKGLLARLFQKNLTRKGEKLFILNKSGLVIGKLKVKYTFTTLYFGQMLSGIGFFRLIPANSLIAKPIKKGFYDDSNLGFFYIAKGENYYGEKLIGEAIRYYKKALSIDSENPKALLGLGECYLSQGLYGAALNNFLTAYSFKENFQSNNDLVNLYFNLAGISVKKAIKIFADSRPARIKKINHLTNAAKYIKFGLKISPGSSSLNYFAGRINYYLGNDQKALTYFKKSIHKSGRFLFDSYWFIAKIFNKRGMRDRAYQYLLKAKKIYPYNPRLLNELKKFQG